MKFAFTLFIGLLVSILTWAQPLQKPSTTMDFSTSLASEFLVSAEYISVVSEIRKKLSPNQAIRIETIAEQMIEMPFGLEVELAVYCPSPFSQGAPECQNLKPLRIKAQVEFVPDSGIEFSNVTLD